MQASNLAQALHLQSNGMVARNQIQANSLTTGQLAIHHELVRCLSGVTCL